MWVGLEGLETLINMQLVTVVHLDPIMCFPCKNCYLEYEEEKDIKNALRKEVLAPFCII